MVKTPTLEQTTALLGKRWYPLIPNPGAMALERDRHKKRIIIGAAGRRSGKTERFKRHVIGTGISRLVDNSFKREEQNYFVGAPVRDQAKRIFWKDLQKFTANIPTQLKDKSESELRLEVSHPTNGKKCAWWVLGFDKPERLEGTDWDGGGVDEFGNTKKGTFEEHISPALSTIGIDPFCWLFGVPEGRNHYYDIAMKAKARANNGDRFGYYTWFSSEVLPPEKIAEERDLLDPKTFAQEYEASWETKSGLVYYAWIADYAPDGNIDNDVCYDKNLPVYIGMDFNIDPMTATLSHHHGKETHVFKGYHERNTNTKQMVEKILNEYPDAPSYVLTPCQSASARQTVADIGVTDLRIIEQVFRWRKCILRIAKRASNPLVRDRVNVVNARLFHKRIKINAEKCPDLIKDFEALAYKEGTSDIDKTDKMRGHISDGFSYSEEYHFPVVERVTSKSTEPFLI